MATPCRRGRFIVFEGGDGVGKTTQARLLAAALERSGRRVVLAREPGGPPGAEALRRLLLEAPAGGWEPLSEALLHNAARAEHLHKTILPALAAGAWVICDRFADSTAAYQGAGLSLPAEALASLRRLVVGDDEPDLVVVLDLDPAASLERASARSGPADRYERMDLAFHRRVRDAFVRIASNGGERYVLLDAAGGVDAVHAAVRASIEQRFGFDLDQER